MDWFTNIVNGQNFIPASIVLVVILCIGIVLVKKGILSFNGKGLSIGIQEKERMIIQNQLEYTHTMIEGTIANLPEGLDKTHAKYIFGRVEYVLTSAIALNHMTTNPSYIRIKQELVYNTVLKRTTNPYFKTPEFKDYCFKFVENLIKQLITIRENG